MLCLLLTSQGNDMPQGTVQHRGWLAISVIIKSSFDTGSVPENPLSESLPSASVHSFIHSLCSSPLEDPWDRFTRLFMAPSHYTTTKGGRATQAPRQLRGVPWRELPTPIKSNLSLNKKVTPYLLRLTMMKGNEDKGSSYRYQYKYYWKVN